MGVAPYEESGADRTDDDGRRDAAADDGGASALPATADGAGSAEAPDGGKEIRAAGGGQPRHPALARALSGVSVPRVVTGLAALLVLAALVLPNELGRLTPGAFVRLPVEAVYAAALLLVLPARARRPAAVGGGVLLGLLTVLKCVDMGFYSILDRPFDLVLDWVLLDDGHAFLVDTLGGTGAIVAVVGIVVLVLALLVVMTLAVVRLSAVVVRHSGTATRTTLIAGTVWMTCATVGLTLTGPPFASGNTAALVENRVNQVRAGVEDEKAFAKVAGVDDFRGTPKDELLTGLRGKDVIFAFIESYGRNAVLNDPEMASKLRPVLGKEAGRLREAGFSSRSAWLKSPTTGAGSWLAHSTLASGLWIENEQRYRTVTASDRLTLTGAFRRTGAWRTVGVMPGVTRSWPEGQFYGFDRVYDSRELGYRGPKFSWSPVPDQYTMSALERLEHGRKDRKPLMSEVILATSHNPWAPLPTTIGWDEVGDGSVYHAQKKAGKDPKDVWRDPARVREEYRRAVEYSVRTLTSYVRKYGDKDTVLVFLGDHQPVPTVVGNHASRDVPVSIVAHDPEVTDRISAWKWEEGLSPGKTAPVWRMDSFRDRFMSAYGPESPSGKGS